MGRSRSRYKQEQANAIATMRGPGSARPSHSGKQHRINARLNERERINVSAASLAANICRVFGRRLHQGALTCSPGHILVAVNLFSGWPRHSQANVQSRGSPRLVTPGARKRRPWPRPPLGIDGLDELPSPPGPERVRLGRWLFYDTRLSGDGPSRARHATYPNERCPTGDESQGVRWTCPCSQNAVVHQHRARS